jgi:hypothetical protein
VRTFRWINSGVLARLAVLAVAGVVVAALAAGGFASSAVAVRRATRLAPACMLDAARTSACTLIVDYFGALNAGRDRKACSLLGERLRLETGGSSCPRVLAMSRGTPFEIVGARTVRSGVQVLVRVGLHELDHWRMLAWFASVGREAGRLRILDTQRSG